MKLNLDIKLTIVNEMIAVYKKNALNHIEKEEMIPASSAVALMRDAIEQKLLLERLIEEEKECE